MVLANISGTGAGVVLGVYALVCLLLFVFRPRDVMGRRRATGCAFGLFVFFGLLLIAFAAWAADAIF